MAKVKITKTFTMPLDEVREGLEKIGKGLEAEHGLKYSWKHDDRVEFTHKSVKGFVEIQGNELLLELKLSMMFAAMAPVVKKRITEMADEHIK